MTTSKFCFVLVLILVGVVTGLASANDLDTMLIIPRFVAESSYWDQFFVGLGTAFNDSAALVPELSLTLRHCWLSSGGSFVEFGTAIQEAIRNDVDAVICWPSPDELEYVSQASDEGIFVVAVIVGGRSEGSLLLSAQANVVLGIDYEDLGGAIAETLLSSELSGTMTLVKTASQEWFGEPILADAIAAGCSAGGLALDRSQALPSAYEESITTIMTQPDSIPDVIILDRPSQYIMYGDWSNCLTQGSPQVFYLAWSETDGELPGIPLTHLMERQFLQGYLAYLYVLLEKEIGWSGYAEPILIGDLVSADPQGFYDFLMDTMQPVETSLASSLCSYPPCKGCPARCLPDHTDLCYQGCMNSFWENLCRVQCDISCSAFCASHCFLLCCVLGN